MQGIRSTAVVSLLIVALLAAACGDNGGGGADDASPIDGILGTQAVQDFAIHLNMFVVGDDGAPVDVLQPIVDLAFAGAGEGTELAGGFFFAPVDGIPARVVDAAGSEISTLSLDLGLLSPPADAVAGVLGALGADPDGSVPSAAPEGAMLVEIVSADYSAERVHLGIGDRLELDLTAVEQLRPGDDLVLQYLFGQTYPGDPSREAGLDELELFADRWNQGLVRLASELGSPEPILSRTAEVREGSTLLTYDQKGDLAQLIGLVASSADPIPELYDDYLNREFGPNDGFESGDVNVNLDVPGSDVQLHVQARRRMGRTESVAIRGPFLAPLVFDGANPLDAAARAVETIRLLVACAAVKTQLMAENEAGRAPSPFVNYPTTRFLPAPRQPGDPGDQESAPEEGEDAEPEDNEQPDADSAPVGCGPLTVPDWELLRECPDRLLRDDLREMNRRDRQRTSEQFADDASDGE